MASDSRPKSKVFIKFLWVALSFGVIICAVQAFSHEYRSAVMLRSFDGDVIEDLRGFEADSMPVTVGGLGELMTKCADLLLTNPLLRLDAVLAGEVAENCGQAASRAIAENPAFARAHAALMVAQAAAFTAEDYRVAQAAAPFEPWPLGTRILAVERRLILNGEIGDDISALLAEDIARAAQSDWGRRMVAALYTRRPALRDLIQHAFENRPEAEQAAFVRALRNLTSR